MNINESAEKELEALAETVNKYISGKRYAHTLSVAAEAARLCEIFELDAETSFDLQCAALLHDITKEKSLSEQLEICKECGIPYGSDELNSPKVLHAITAPEIVKRELPKYAKASILSAIRWHTTGKPDMTLGEKLIYLADYIEATRDFPDCIKLREEFYSVSKPDSAHLDRVLLHSFEMTLDDLRENNKPIYPLTLLSAGFLKNSITAK